MHASRALSGMLVFLWDYKIPYHHYLPAVE